MHTDLPTPLCAARRLTPRQREIAAALAQYHSNKQIAAKLGIREDTVKKQIRDMYVRLGISGRSELAVLYAQGDPRVVVQRSSGDDDPSGYPPLKWNIAFFPHVILCL